MNTKSNINMTAPVAKLVRQNTPSLNLLDNLNAIFIAKKDRRHGIPYMDEGTGQYKSPFCDERCVRCEDGISRLFLRGALATGTYYKEVDGCDLETARNDQKIEQLQKRLDETAPDATELKIRKDGEEDIPESGVMARRKREFDKTQNPIREQIGALEESNMRLAEQRAHALSEAKAIEDVMETAAKRLEENTRHVVFKYYRITGYRKREKTCIGDPPVIDFAERAAKHYYLLHPLSLNANIHASNAVVKMNS